MEGKMVEKQTPIDQNSVMSTRSLVQLYDQKEGPAKPQTESVRYVNKAPATGKKPESWRSSTTLSSSEGAHSPPLPNRPDHAGLQVVKSQENGSAVAAAIKSAGVQSSHPAQTSRKAPVPPPPRRSQRTLDEINDVQNTFKMPLSGKPNNALKASVMSTTPRKPLPLPVDRPALPKRPSTNSDTIPTHAATSQSISSRRPIPSPKGASPSYSSSASGQPSPHYAPQLSVDSLANAMVASSLASSRASSPSKPRPTLPRRGSSRSNLLNAGDYLKQSQSNNDLSSRTPSPEKRMRQTMRSPPKNDSDVPEHRRHNHNRLGRHPNKHHEGDRKRYRTQVTERERKRYEGVWAANRGILIEPSADDPEPVPGDGEVLNLVVREIWQRSKLPDSVLEEVWDLVNLRGRDRLGRDEFVVGMWLIDQSLKGNKLPIKVSESVWSSVRHLSGIKIPRGR